MDKCYCNGKPQVDTDYMTNATIIECQSCNRNVGAHNIHAATVMWNAAMQGLKLQTEPKKD